MEIQPKIEIQRTTNFIDGRLNDDFLTIRYYPNGDAPYSYEAFIIATKNLKGLIDALNKKSLELEQKELF